MVSLPIVEGELNLHLNQQCNPGQNSRPVYRGGFPFIKSLTLSIPENLDIDRILEENPPLFRYKRDKFIYILDLINSIPARNREILDNYTGFTPICKSILGGIIKGYRKYLDYLIEREIVVEDRQYIPDEKCRGLKFTEIYQTRIKSIEITDWTLIKNIRYLRKERDQSATNSLLFMQKWLEGIEVDFEAGKAYLEEEYARDLENPRIRNPLLKYNSRLHTFQNLHIQPSILFIVDTTGGRLHTELTHMMSELRKFATYEKQTLCAVDITNSQPYLLTSFLDIDTYNRNNMGERIDKYYKNKGTDIDTTIMLGVLADLINEISEEDDVRLYREIVTSGNFYERFGEILVENNYVKSMEDPRKLREKVKKITFLTLFSENASKSSAIRIFRDTFPNVYGVMSFIKQHYHPTLAVVLQNLEADLVLHKACKLVDTQYPEIPIFTVHDSIATTEENVPVVESILNGVLLENIGISPVLKRERWV